MKLRSRILIWAVLPLAISCKTLEIPGAAPASLSLGQTVNVAPETFGVNGALLWGKLRYGDPELARLYSDIGLTHIRFPGGTIANFYDWRSGSFGCTKARDAKSLDRIGRFEQSRKRLPRGYMTGDFLTFAKQTGTSFALVVNVACSTPADTRAWMQSVRDSGQVVTRVEMGNELHFPEYDWAFRSGREYIDAARRHAAAVRAVFPEARIGVVVSSIPFTHAADPKTLAQRNPRIGRQLLFDDAAAQADFADAYIVHLYSRGSSSPIATTSPGTLAAYSNAMSHFDARFPVMLDYLRQKGLTKELWITEWGIAAFQAAGDDLKQSPLYALFVANVLIRLATTDAIAVANLHNLPDLWNETDLRPAPALSAVLSLFGSPMRDCGTANPFSGGPRYTGTNRSYRGSGDSIQGVVFRCPDSEIVIAVNKFAQSYSLSAAQLGLDARTGITLRSVSVDGDGALRQTGPRTVSAAGSESLPLAPFSVVRVDIPARE